MACIASPDAIDAICYRTSKKSVGRSVYGSYPPFYYGSVGVGVSRCGPAAVVGRGCEVFRGGKIIISIGDNNNGVSKVSAHIE